MSSRSESMCQYFGVALKFFQDHKWVYDFKATEVLFDSVIERVPLVFQDFFMALDDADRQFLEIMNLRLNDNWPEEIQRFVSVCQDLRSMSKHLECHDSHQSAGSPDSRLNRDSMKQPKKWSPKKFSEVTHVGNFVGQMCRQEGCDLVFDIGSGLGYLTSFLALNFKIPVIGLERDASKVAAAEKAYLSNEPGSSTMQTYKCVQINENTEHEIDLFAPCSGTIGLTALHACGDLTPWSLKYFVRKERCKLLAVVPCCYHKMTEPNFPVSSALKRELLQYEDQSFLKNQWLWRLASQRTGNQFLNDVNKETKNLFYRACVEKFISSGNMQLIRKKRKLCASKVDDTFEEYLKISFGTDGGFDIMKDETILKDADLDAAMVEIKIVQLKFNRWRRVLTGILAMQGAIQMIAEELILLDRLQYLEESDNLKMSGIIRVIPESVSPRGLVLFGVKIKFMTWICAVGKLVRGVGFSKTTTTVVHNFSTRTQLKDLLLTMPKETVHVPVLKEGRKAKRESAFKYPPGTISLQVLGSGAKGAPRSLYLFTDQTRYLFNCGEGTQRLAHEHKMKLAKLDHIFITNNSWDNIGGLPGVALTVQDIGVPEITIHGPLGVENLFEGTRRFVILKNLKIKVANTLSTGFADHILEVDYVRLLPTTSDEVVDKSSTSSEESVIEEDETDYYAPIKGCKRQLEITPEDEEQSKRTKVENVEGENSEFSLCFVCRPTKKEGTLLIAKCVEYGVPPGPLLGKLKAGQDVTLPNGKVVKSDDVRSPDCPGPVFIVVDCPHEKYLESLVTNPIINKYHNPTAPEDLPHIVVHFTPSHIMLNPRYQEWMEMFRATTKHMVLNDACVGMGSEAVHRVQHKLNLLDKDMFPLLNEEGVEMFYPVTENSKTLLPTPKIFSELKCPVIMGNTLLKYELRPTIEIDSTSTLTINPEEDIRGVLAMEEFSAKLENLKTNLKMMPDSDTDVYPEFQFIGTGSCIPNKTRNTSGILVNIDANKCILMDCGEGTYGQLVRFYGSKNVDEILAKLKAIYISHLHADHHIGLVQVIRKRREALKALNIPHSPVYLLAPHQIQTWLHLYNRCFEKIRSAYQLIPNVELKEDPSVVPDSVLLAELKHILGLSQVRTTYVRHCPNAFGVAITHSSGWKITYSGDTMPCDSLVEIGQNSDVLIHEATMEDDLKKEAVLKMHSTTSEAIDIGNKMNAKFILLTHFSQRYAKVPVINENFGKNVGIAFDNMKIRKCDLPKIPLMYDAMNTMFTSDVEDMEQKAQRRQRREELKSMNTKQMTQKTSG